MNERENGKNIKLCSGLLTLHVNFCFSIFTLFLDDQIFTNKIKITQHLLIFFNYTWLINYSQLIKFILSKINIIRIIFLNL